MSLYDFFEEKMAPKLEAIARRKFFGESLRAEKNY